MEGLLFIQNMASKNLKLPAFGRKGGYDLGRKWIYLIVCIIIIAFLFFILKAKFLGEEMARIECSDEVNAVLAMNKIVACMGYSDGGFGMIDLDKFTEENLENCAGEEGRKIALSVGDKMIGEVPENGIEYERVLAVYKNGEEETAIVKLQMEKKC
ncbi:hypothetical protein HZB88_01120 [archaeon]|nr:hypothetical protein [archaeon]